MAFDLDKNKFVGAAEIRHVLVNIGEQVSWQPGRGKGMSFTHTWIEFGYF